MAGSKQLFLLGFALMTLLGVQAQSKRFDTTMKVGKAGYRVTTRNNNPEKNMLTVEPLGFDANMREFSFEVKGRVARAEVDDLNRDNFPDLVIYLVTNDSIPKGNVVGISSDANTSVKPILFPDIIDDPKLRDGYKGYDQFMLMEGQLIRRFPLYTTDSTTQVITPTGKMRQVMYTIRPGERGSLKFFVQRSYDYNKQ
ncbi:MAG: hypothetical protein GXC72_02215 [Chitinophagaceae bacterium]|jgi:hypothetical protein|nr:hypothetical protein [Chitinophagaceae bacterium]